MNWVFLSQKRVFNVLPSMINHPLSQTF